MMFVDTNVFMYAVGREHPLRADARAFFSEAVKMSRPLVTSAEVLQELLHAYLPFDRIGTLDAAFALVDGCVDGVWSVEADDARLARALVSEFPGLGARDLLHVACCRRRSVTQIMTFDRSLRSAMGG
jgi:uncharacterized protein